MTKMKQLQDAFSAGIPVSALQMRAREIPSRYFTVLETKGEILRIAPGVYVASDADVSEYSDYEEASVVAPQGVFCLFSALRLHELTDENPHRLHMAIPSKSHPPKTSLPLVFYYACARAYQYGIETRISRGVEIRVYSVEKTIVDCFKARNKIGLDVAVKALREARENHRTDNNKIWDAAQVCRMTKIMRPYLEATQ